MRSVALKGVEQWVVEAGAVGSKEGFFKVAEIIACLCAAGSDLVERKISDGEAKGTIARRMIL